VDTKELEALNILDYSPVDENGGMPRPPFLTQKDSQLKSLPNVILTCFYIIMGYFV
jgi:hypothetical protein